MLFRITRMSHLLTRLFVACLLLLCVASAQAAEWSVPLAGNAFRNPPGNGGNRASGNGTVAEKDADPVLAVYFHVDRPAVLDLSLNGRARDGEPAIATRIGDKEVATSLTGDEFAIHKIGRFEVAKPGYVRVDVQGAIRNGKMLADIRDVVVSSDTDQLVLDYVKDNRGNMFLWGRRGPSVHLTYELPSDRKLQYAYCEITVPKGEDPIGSYFMANGFAEGYFGIQVNGPEERRVLFSVWSPFRTNNPRDIPEDQRVALLARGTDVRTGEFGNEGSGGQSFLVYPWKADVTYRFLTEVKPVGETNTTYTSWFGDKAKNEWRLIASFRRPKTDTHLRRFHSFLESFNPGYGHFGRRAHYGNVWVRDTDEQWHECTKARFSVDATGRGRHRLDFMGGAEGEHFFLRNCGFFNETGKPGDVFTRESTADKKPQIDFTALPRS
jgi:hypothetical protein